MRFKKLSAKLTRFFILKTTIWRLASRRKGMLKSNDIVAQILVLQYKSNDPHNLRPLYQTRDLCTPLSHAHDNGVT